jgi:hypothetical protein
MQCCLQAIAHPSAPSVSPATNPPEDKSDNEKKLRNLKKVWYLLLIYSMGLL